jgi:hypothetical protein
MNPKCATKFIAWPSHFAHTCLIYLLTYLLMELSPSWEAANCAATQEILSILWNPKVHLPNITISKMAHKLKCINLKWYSQ